MKKVIKSFIQQCVFLAMIVWHFLTLSSIPLWIIGFILAVATIGLVVGNFTLYMKMFAPESIRINQEPVKAEFIYAVQSIKPFRLFLSAGVLNVIYAIYFFISGLMPLFALHVVFTLSLWLLLGMSFTILSEFTQYAREQLAKQATENV